RAHSAPVVRSLFGDDDVVHVALLEPLRRDADELRLGAKLLDRLAPRVAHAAAEPAHELVEDAGERAAVRDAPFDPFGDELLVGSAALSVAVLRALAHRAHRAHAAVHLVAAPLVEHEL